MLTINHAILHAYDFETSSNYESTRELDVSDKAIRSYVTRLARKTLSSSESKHGEFSPESNFHQELLRYRASELDFVALSKEIGDFFFEELMKSDDKLPYDLLVADVTDTEKASAPQTDEEVDASFEGSSREVLAIVLLARKQGYVHDVREDMYLTDIVKTDALLPLPTQKVDSYAAIDLGSFEIDFADKARTIAGQESFIIPDGLLQCTQEASTREVIQSVTLAVQDVAEEYGLTPAVEVSRAKAYVTEQADEAEAIEPREVGKKIFADRPEAQARYEEKMRESASAASIPEEVPVRPSVAHRIAKNHRIRTDTGIEITFPSEYSSNDDFIEFTTLPDGHISITIKGVEHIENR